MQFLTAVEWINWKDAKREIFQYRDTHKNISKDAMLSAFYSKVAVCLNQYTAVQYCDTKTKILKWIQRSWKTFCVASYISV